MSASGRVRRVLAFALAAALLYGAVGAFANRVHGGEAMWSAALVQGGASALTTGALSSLIDLVLAWTRRRQREGGGDGHGNANGRGRTALAPLATGVLVAQAGALSQIGLHAWAGTPEPVATVALPAIGLLVYCPLYARAAAARAAAATGVGPPDTRRTGAATRR